MPSSEILVVSSGAMGTMFGCLEYLECLCFFGVLFMFMGGLRIGLIPFVSSAGKESDILWSPTTPSQVEDELNVSHQPQIN